MTNTTGPVEVAAAVELPALFALLLLTLLELLFDKNDVLAEVEAIF